MTAVLIRDSFPNQKGVVVSETAPMLEDLMNISMEVVIFTAEWVPTAILPDNLSPVVDSSSEEVVEITPELKPEKEKPPTAYRSNCLRSSAPGRVRKKNPSKKRRIRTQDMIEDGTYWLSESALESFEDGCMLLRLTQDVIDLD